MKTSCGRGGRLRRGAACGLAALAFCVLLLPLRAGTFARAASNPAPAAADPVAERQKQLEALKKEIEANRREIEQLRVKERDLSKVSERTRRDTELTRRYLRELAAHDDSIRSDLAERQVDLFDKESALRESVRRLKKGIVGYYKLRELSGPELLFSSRTFGELFARSQFMTRLIDRERIELAALADERQQLAETASALELRRRSLELLQEEKKREQQRLERAGASVREQIAGVRDERTERERHVKELEASQGAIRKMIERLELERSRSRDRGEAPSFKGSLASGKGRLDWPVRGSVVGEFGLEVNPKYGTSVPSNGIDIASPEGTPVRAVAPGLVEFVDWLPGYGRTVILNHGSGYYTLYAHAASVAVRRGEKVTAGQQIATVGDTDSVKGACLHFEVRQGERALSPREWLR